MILRSLTRIILAAIIILTPIALSAMEAEEEKPSTQDTDLITFYRYDATQKTVTETVDTSFKQCDHNPDIRGFSFSKSYDKLVLGHANSTHFLALFYCLTQNQEQFVGVINAYWQETLNTVFKHVFHKVSSKQIVSSVLAVKYADEDEEEWSCPGSKLAKLMGKENKSHCRIERLKFPSDDTDAELEITIDNKDSDKSCFSTGTTILPTYFCNLDEPHYADGLAKAPAWFWLCNLT